MVEEAGPDIQPGQPARGRPLARHAEQPGDGGPGEGVTAAVRDRDERGMGQVWIPHSVLPEPVHRPLRGSAPASTFIVQVAQPIDGYPS